MKFRLYPTPEQEAALLEHCSHARFVWNLALEQFNLYRRGLGPTPGWAEQSRQLTEARASFPWLAAGSTEIQHKALRDFDVARQAFFRGIHRRPTWRKKGQSEGFRVHKDFRFGRLNRRWGYVTVPKVGEVRFRWTRHPGAPKSYRVKRDAAGRWWVAFTVLPSPIERTPTGAMIGLDMGITNTVATSDGMMLQLPRQSNRSVARAQRTQARRVKGSNRRIRARLRVARLRAHEAEQAKDWMEKATTDLVRLHDFIAVEKLQIRNMTRGNRGLNREILARRWGIFLRRLREKCELAGVEFVAVDPRNTSRTCAVCKYIAAESRESQARFACIVCGHEAHADTNAASNVLAAGLAVSARGGKSQQGLPMNREPQRAVA